MLLIKLVESHFMSVWRRLQSRSERITPLRQKRVSSHVLAGQENWIDVARLLREHDMQPVDSPAWTRPIPASSAIAGRWYLCQQPASITEQGQHLTFTNELGQIATGRMLDSHRLIAEEWGNLVGVIVKTQILWNNNTVWDRTRHLPPSLHGNWSHANRPTEIRQTAHALTFINERGESSTGRFLDRTQVLATGWSDLRGTIIDSNTIHWSNSSIWIRR